MKYKIDQLELDDLVREVSSKDTGSYSSQLQALIHGFRSAPLAGKLVIVELEPHRRWVIARLPARFGDPLELLDGEVFENRLKTDQRLLALRLVDHFRKGLS